MSGGSLPCYGAGSPDLSSNSMLDFRFRLRGLRHGCTGYGNDLCNA